MSGKEVCGVYAIRCSVTGRQYVGSSVAILARWKQHRGLLRKGKHHSPYLQNSWAKYGEEAFEFVILEECDRDELLIVEQRYLDGCDKPFNCAPIAGSRRGVPHDAKAKAKMSAAQRRTPRTPEWKANISAGLKASYKVTGTPWLVGRPVSEEARRKSSADQKGKPRPWTTGIHPSAETIARRSAALKGKVYLERRGIPLSPEHRAKISAAQKGVPCPSRSRVISVEERERRGAAQRGKPRPWMVGREISDEMRANQTQAARARGARQRAARGPYPHGTLGAYGQDGCRCDLCRDAKAAEMRALRKRWREEGRAR